MAITVTTAVKNELLNGLLRTTGALNSANQVGGFYFGNTSLSTLYKYKVSLTGASWGSPSNGGITLLSTPVLTTNSGTPTGTIVEAAYRTVGDGAYAIQGLVAGVSGGKDVVLDTATITSGSAVSITDARIFVPASNGTVRINTLLRNRILRILVRQDTVGSAASGSIDVYSGSAPSDADSAATGTLLISFPTTTTSWASASSGSSALSATLTTTGSTAGTAGYARFSWTANGETYVIQGSIGASGTDFIINNTAITVGGSFSITSATIGL